MITILQITAYLQQLAPFHLAEDWDNVGLLVGRREQPVNRVMTCLTVTPASAAEAIRQQADLIVTHHPLPFSATKRLTDETTVGRLLLDLIAAGVAVFSAHTAFDSAADGINQRLAEGLGLADIQPLIPHVEGHGSGRFGRLHSDTSLDKLAEQLKKFLKINHLQIVGQSAQSVRTVAVACGAAGEFLDAAHRQGCDVLVLGETRFHTCLEAEALGVGLLMPGHFASERFAMEALAEVLDRDFPDLDVWASRDERDPIRYQ